jgi:gas vesicle protein
VTILEKGKGLDFFLGFLTGTLVGAAIAIILAPQSGEETREYLKDQAILIKDKASEVASEMRDKATEIAGEVKGKADKMKDKAIVIAGEVKQSVVDSRNRLKNVISSADKNDDLIDQEEVLESQELEEKDA